MVDFGDPSTWEMNVDQFIDSGLPKEKPQELLDLQEQNRKQRLLQSLQRIGGGLEDSSLDFINRENFAEGKFGQNQFTKKLNKSLNDPKYIKKLVTRINLPEYADMSFKDLFREKVITNREMRKLQKLGYKAKRQGKKFNNALAKARAEKRLELDPNRLKDKAKKIAGRNKKTVIHHGLPKRIPESLTNLIVDKTGKTLFSEAEGVLQNLDFEKQKLLKDPTKNKKRINQIQAIEDRLKKGKTIPEVTSISTRTNKPITKTNVSLNPEQKGLYGYEYFDIDKKGNLTKKLKGVDLSQTIAGLSDDLLNKVDFRNASPEDQEKLVKKIASKIKPDGPTLGMNAIAPAKAAELVDFTQLPKDFKNVSDEMIKPLVEKGKIFGKKSAGQILSMARPAAKLTGLELLLGSAFAPLDIGEGRPMKDVALNVATLGIGVPVKDARRVSAFADRFGLKKDLFNAKMKQTGIGATRGGYGDLKDLALTEREQEALRAETYFKEKILQPELDQLLKERQSASDPYIGLDEEGGA